LTWESTRSWPPSCSTILATTANPRPGQGQWGIQSYWQLIVPTLASEFDRSSEDSTCSNSRNIFSNFPSSIPHPVSETTISTAVCFELLKPSGSSNVLHQTEINPVSVYLTTVINVSHGIHRVRINDTHEHWQSNFELQSGSFSNLLQLSEDFETHLQQILYFAVKLPCDRYAQHRRW